MAETEDNKDNQNQTEGDKTSSNHEDVKAENASESDIEDFEIKYKETYDLLPVSYTHLTLPTIYSV